jgi:hypothetical protein
MSGNIRQGEPSARHLQADSAVNGTFKASLIQGGSVLFAAFIGVWGGREIINNDIRAMQEANKANADAISKLANNVTLLTIQVEKLTVTSTKELAEMRDQVRVLQQWRVDISDLASKRGVEIPELRRRVEILERKNR